MHIMKTGTNFYVFLGANFTMGVEECLTDSLHANVYAYKVSPI